ncbi:MAG: hypothetical protein IJU65_06065 [Desulfovibrio sp.]|nr:hypothetical protein [Desulfovibrio sp.]
MAMIVDDAIWLDERGADAARNNRLEREQADADLACVAGTPEGFRFLLWLLSRWHAEGLVSADEEAIALRNEAEDLLAHVARVHPKACLQLIAALRDIPQ